MGTARQTFTEDQVEFPRTSVDPDRYQQVIASNGSYADIGIKGTGRAIRTG